MVINFYFVIATTLFVAFPLVTGQEEKCRPKDLQGIMIMPDNMLVWLPPDNDTCVTLYYMVYIHDKQNILFILSPRATQLSLYFLPICESYTFTVAAVSTQGVQGPSIDLSAKTPYPIDQDLRIELFSASIRERGAYLEWKVADELKECPERFRLTIIDTETDIPVDLYFTSNSATITNLIPCTNYIFGIRAVYSFGVEGSYTSTRLQAPASNISAPALQSIALGSTSVELTWQLENYSLNRCPLSSITVDSSPYFKITYPITDQINRPPFRTQLTGLQPDTMYVLNVTAINSAGTSAAAVVTVQTLQN